MEAKEIIERLEKIIEDEGLDKSGIVCKTAIAKIIRDFEEDEFRDEVYGQFGWCIEGTSYFAPDLIAAAREGRKVEFIKNARYIADEQWLEDNFEKFGLMMELVCQLADAKEATDAADVKEK